MSLETRPKGVLAVTESVNNLCGHDNNVSWLSLYPVSIVVFLCQGKTHTPAADRHNDRLAAKERLR